MTTLNLASDEIRTVQQCLKAAAEGPFFPDWEFQTLTGVSRDQMRQLAFDWPGRDGEQSKNLDIAVGALNNLLGYPHHSPAAVWNSFIGVSPNEVGRLLKKVLACME